MSNETKLSLINSVLNDFWELCDPTLESVTAVLTAISTIVDFDDSNDIKFEEDNTY